MEETIALYPAPGIGHIVSMVELSKQLLLHLPHHHCSFTILLTTGLLDHPSIDTYIHRISTSHPSIKFLRFPSTSVNPSPTLTFAAKAFQFIRDNTTNVTSALTTISNNTSSSIKAFIIDMFCASAMSAASSMGIPVFCFFTSGAAVLALYTYFPIIHDQTTQSLKNITEELHIPGNAPLKGYFMPEPVLDREDPAYSDMLYFCNHLPKYNGIIVNTFQELEPNAVKVITEGLCFPDPKQRPNVYYIGPLIADPTDQQQSQLLGDGKDQCLSWLEKQPCKSVVYLCFGSRGTFSVSQLKEIADGLEKSGKRFLWVVKRPTTYPDDEEFELGSVLPMGFLERTKGRGLVVKSWAPQVEVLSCDSVGVFVSHCGWNSVLEGVVAGVPMIAWPLYAEQHVNRNVMVGDMKVAVAVEQREGDGSVSGEEVEKRVREVMESERGKELKENSLKMKEIALAAFGESGSSKKALEDLVQTFIQ